MAAEGGGGWLSGLLGGGGGSSTLDLYGDLFTEKQKAALQQREMTQGLFRMAETLGKMAQPSRAPPGLGGTLGALGAGLGAFGGGTGEETALKGMEIAAKVKKAQSEAKIREQMFGPEANARLEALLRGFGGGGVPAPVPPIVPPAGTYAPDAPAAASGAMVPGGAATQPPLLAGANVQFGPPGPGAPGFPSTPNPFGGSNLAEVKDYSQALGPPEAPAVATAPPPQQNTGLLPPPPRAPDQMVGPDGQPLPQGVLPNMLASLAGGTSGDRLPFRLAAATQTPGAGTAGVDVLDRVIAPLESGNRNIHQQVVSPNVSTAQGYYQITNSTWKDTAPKAGVDLDKYPTAMSAPREVQKQVAQKLLETRGLQPWADSNPEVAAATGYRGRDTVIPSGPRLQRSDLRNVADTGLPAAPVPPGVNPQAMNALLIELAQRNAAAEALGMGNPYGSLLGVLQGSPQYKAAIESATRGAGLPFVRREAEEKAAGTFPFEAELKKYQSALDRANKDAEMLGAARNDPAEIKVSDGKGGEVIVQGTREQKVRAANGLAVPELGIIGITPPVKPGGATPPPAPGVATPAALGAEAPPPAGSLARTPVERPETLKQQEIDQKFLEEKRVQAESSRRAIMAANDTRSLIEKGVVAGAYADERTRLLKLGQLLNLTGKDDNERIKNTETYIANLGRNMKEGLKGLGPPISNIDIQVAEKIAGGQNLTTQGMLELLRLEEKYHRLALQDYGKLLTNAPKSRYDKSIKEPPTFGAPIADSPEGVAHWWDGKTWRPL